MKLFGKWSAERPKCHTSRIVAPLPWLPLCGGFAVEDSTKAPKSARIDAELNDMSNMDAECVTIDMDMEAAPLVMTVPMPPSSPPPAHLLGQAPVPAAGAMVPIAPRESWLMRVREKTQSPAHLLQAPATPLPLATIPKAMVPSHRPSPPKVPPPARLLAQAAEAHRAEVDDSVAPAVAASSKRAIVRRPKPKQRQIRSRSPRQGHSSHSSSNASHGMISTPLGQETQYNIKYRMLNKQNKKTCLEKSIIHNAK